MRAALIALAVVASFAATPLIGTAHAAPLASCELAMAERMGAGVNSTEPSAELYACEHGVTIQAARRTVTKQGAALQRFYKRAKDAEENLCNSPDYFCGTLTIERDKP